MAVRYRDEVLKPIVGLYAAAVGPTFVLMDDNARPHRADIVDDYLDSEGIAQKIPSARFSKNSGPGVKELLEYKIDTSRCSLENTSRLSPIHFGRNLSKSE
ncbi:transposable element Tcb1 transposase [Trichonephila clavipes]|nr:transposable element Tcb1 transposase [Trichonephila clavipes]